jgi:hypothetical protein
MKARALALMTTLISAEARGQDHQHEHAMPPDVERPGPQPESTMHMLMNGPLGIPAVREGSGTAWLPDASEMRGHHVMAGGFSLMLHYDIAGGYERQGGDHGAGQPLSTNWLMGMADRDLLGGQLKARAMLSLEPLTVGEDGYPLLLQTGESRKGQRLVDRQHPHDLFMETALMYTRPIASNLAVQVYGGPAGEPALGPVAFPHRPSASADPLAPISHHWLDSTHISFGVVTAGVMTRAVKLEGSWFNGREPDEHRYDFDLRGLDSYAARLSVNPAEAWSLQASYGYLASPEELEPDVSVQRYTASALHATRWGEGRSWATTAAVGINNPSHGRLTYALLLESSVDLGVFGTTFMRAEQLTKGSEEFGGPEGGRFAMASLVLGHLHAFPDVASIEPALGVRLSVNVVDDDLRPRYGTRFPIGGMAYVRLTPAKM